MNKKPYKFGHYTPIPKNQKINYIFSKKRKDENTFLFKVYGIIFIELKYYETDELGLKIKLIVFDIKFKPKILEYLNKDNKIDVIEYNNIKFYKNE